jgi:alanyl-tRNA synthetase
MYADFTPYRVIADHARSAAFLIADGVVPGNAGRNYICRMIIRRAARFGTKIGLTNRSSPKWRMPLSTNTARSTPNWSRAASRSSKT